MTPDQFVDYILTQMDAETALRKLMKTQVAHYGKLKIGAPIDPGENETISPWMIMAIAAMDLGWNIGVETDKVNVEGLTVGTAAYMKRNWNHKQHKEVLEKCKQFIKENDWDEELIAEIDKLLHVETTPESSK